MDKRGWISGDGGRLGRDGDDESVLIHCQL